LKLLICFGTRPEAIKMAPVFFELKKNKFNVKICVTAQHREMLDQVLDFFEITPDFDLNLMKQNQSLNGLFSNILESIEVVLNKEYFDLVLVHGDTTTSAAVALAAFHKEIKVGHIEAGLRTFNKKSPFPEELNRQLTGKIADYHFAPTKKAKQNLVEDRVEIKTIVVTGNTVVDALYLTLNKLKNGYTNRVIEDLKNSIDFTKKILLVTGHRRESFGKGFEEICKAILEIANRQDIEIIYPVHLNPNVQNTVFNLLSNVPNIHLIEPLAYPSFVWIMSKSSLIISDSGGIQEEAPSLKIPVLVTRETTERLEGIEAGFSFLVGIDKIKICKKANDLLDYPISFDLKGNPFGDGKGSNRICNYIKNIE